MNRWSLFWQMVTGGDKPNLTDHASRILALEKRTTEIERRQDAVEAFRRFGEGK